MGLSPEEHRLLSEPPAAPLVLHAAAAAGSPFASAWRNYVKSIFKKGFWYKFPLWPSVCFYISENKTLAGKEDKNYEGEAFGRKLAVSFFEKADGGFVQRVHKSSIALQIQLLTVAELLQTSGVALRDPQRTSAETELLLEAQYENLNIQRFVGILETGADEVHIYSLSEETNAEEALAVELAPQQRTKMVLARCLQRNEDLEENETLQSLWSLTLPVLQARAQPFLPAPQAPAANAARGGGRARGRGKGRGRGH